MAFDPKSSSDEESVGVEARDQVDEDLVKSSTPSSPIEARAADSSSLAERRASARSVLLVDDTPVIRHLAQHVLEEAGYDAHSAEDGVAALGFLRSREFPIDVVVTDLAMPQMDGFTLIRELRKLSPETRIVLMTGYVDAVELAERSAERPDLVLPKPFRPPELLEAVSTVLTIRP